MKIKKTSQMTMVYFLLIIISLGFLLPIGWTFVTALKSPRIANAIPPQWIGFDTNWSNYEKAWKAKEFAKSFFNTIVIGLVSVALTVVLSIPAAYALSRFHLRFSKFINVGILGVRVIPEMMFIVPLFILYNRLGLYDTILGMVLVFQIFNLPFSIWLLRSYFAQIPIELEEAASLDGASQTYILTRVIVPLLGPGISAAAILSMIRIWVELLFPLSLTYKKATTVSIAIANFKGYGSFDLPLLAAAAIIATVPQVLFVIFAQKYIVKGLTLGSVKG